MIGFRSFALICAGVVVISAVAAGCVTENNVLSNDEIIEEVKKCEAAGLDSTIEYWHQASQAYPRRVTCKPKQQCPAIVVQEKKE